jgi:hypothetical protein
MHSFASAAADDPDLTGQGPVPVAAIFDAMPGSTQKALIALAAASEDQHPSMLANLRLGDRLLLEALDAAVLGEAPELTPIGTALVVHAGSFPPETPEKQAAPQFQTIKRTNRKWRGLKQRLGHS